MTSAADQLAKKIGLYTRYGISGALNIIEDVDRIEPRFSRSVLALLDAMGPDSIYLRGRVIQALYDGVNDRDRARRVLHEMILGYAELQVEMIVGDIGQAPSIGWYINVSCRIESERPEFAVDVFEQDLETLTRHYYPLALAVDWLVRSNSDEVTDFVTWAGQQDDMNEVLALAWEQRHVDPVKLQEIVELRKEAHGSLRNGVI